MPNPLRLDHVILEVPDIHRAYRRLRELGFPEAWPIGPFWRPALTAGLAAGPINLELQQPAPPIPAVRCRTLVFEPPSVEAASVRLQAARIPFSVSEKIEDDPALLQLRGFSAEACAHPQPICVNVIPAEADRPYPFFYCEYSPFLRAHLAPGTRPVAVPLQVAKVVYGLRDPDRAIHPVRTLGLAISPVEYVKAEEDGVVAILTAGGTDVLAALKEG